MQSSQEKRTRRLTLLRSVIEDLRKQKNKSNLDSEFVAIKNKLSQSYEDEKSHHLRKITTIRNQILLRKTIEMYENSREKLDADHGA